MREITEKSSVWLDAAMALQELAQRQPKTATFAFRVRRLMRVVLPIAEDVEQSRSAIIDRYTERAADGQPVAAGPNQVRLTDADACTRELRELMAIEVTLRVEPIRAEDLEAEGIVPTPSLAYRLGPLLTEPAIGGDGVRETAAVQAEAAA